MQKWVPLTFVIVLALASASVYAAPEKGKKCSDGLDNDDDGLIDGNDPDCSLPMRAI